MARPGHLVARRASVHARVPRGHGVNHQNAAPLTHTGRRDARLERRHIALKRPGEVDGRVALERHALDLRSVAGVQRRVSEIERSYLRRNLKHHIDITFNLIIIFKSNGSFILYN